MDDDDDEIAVVGIGCNFPGGESVIAVLFERKENKKVDLSLSRQHPKMN